MNKYNSLPEEAKRRRVIMILPSEELNQLEINAESDSSIRELLWNKQISLLDDSTQDDSFLVQKIINSGLVDPGTILIQSPYNTSDYAKASNASYNFAQAKCINFATLCGILGAKTVVVEQMELKDSNGETKFSGDINTLYGGGEAEFERKAWNKMKQEIQIKQKYASSKPNIEKARKYLIKNQLLSNPLINDLIYMREEGTNIEELEFNLSVTEESKKI